MEYPHNQAYWRATSTVEPTYGLPSLTSLLIYWWDTFSVEHTNGPPSLLSLPIFWWATFSAEPADGLPSLSSLLIYWWATSLGEPTYELPSLSSLLMRWTHCHPDVGLPPLKSIHMDYTVPHGLAYWLAAFPLEPTRQWCDLFLFWIVYKSMCTNNFID